MTDEQKVLYLFNQTCIYMSGHYFRVNISDKAHFRPNPDFEDVYKFLETSLNEKLSAING